jgi:hypothetical protein
MREAKFGILNDEEKNEVMKVIEQENKDVPAFQRKAKEQM